MSANPSAIEDATGAVIFFLYAGLSVIFFVIGVKKARRQTDKAGFILVPCVVGLFFLVNIIVAIQTLPDSNNGFVRACMSLSYALQSFFIPLLLVAYFELNYEVHKRRSANFFCMKFDRSHRKKEGCCSIFLRYSIWSLAALIAILFIIANAEYIKDPETGLNARRFASGGADYSLDDYGAVVTFFAHIVLFLFLLYSGWTLWSYGTTISTDVQATRINPWCLTFFAAVFLILAYFLSPDDWDLAYLLQAAYLCLMASLAVTSVLIDRNLKLLQDWGDVLEFNNEALKIMAGVTAASGPTSHHRHPENSTRELVSRATGIPAPRQPHVTHSVYDAHPKAEPARTALHESMDPYKSPALGRNVPPWFNVDDVDRVSSTTTAPASMGLFPHSDSRYSAVSRMSMMHEPAELEGGVNYRPKPQPGAWAGKSLPLWTPDPQPRLHGARTPPPRGPPPRGPPPRGPPPRGPPGDSPPPSPSSSPPSPASPSSLSWTIGHEDVSPHPKGSGTGLRLPSPAAAGEDDMEALSPAPSPKRVRWNTAEEVVGASSEVPPPPPPGPPSGQAESNEAVEGTYQPGPIHADSSDSFPRHQYSEALPTADEDTPRHASIPEESTHADVLETAASPPSSPSPEESSAGDSSKAHEGVVSPLVPDGLHTRAIRWIPRKEQEWSPLAADKARKSPPAKHSGAQGGRERPSSLRMLKAMARRKGRGRGKRGVRRHTYDPRHSPRKHSPRTPLSPASPLSPVEGQGNGDKDTGNEIGPAPAESTHAEKTPVKLPGLRPTDLSIEIPGGSSSRDRPLLPHERSVYQPRTPLRPVAAVSAEGAVDPVQVVAEAKAAWSPRGDSIHRPSTPGFGSQPLHSPPLRRGHVTPVQAAASPPTSTPVIASGAPTPGNSRVDDGVSGGVIPRRAAMKERQKRAIVHVGGMSSRAPATPGPTPTAAV